MNFKPISFLRGIRPALMRAIAGFAAFAAAVLLLPSLPAEAGSGRWTSTGPYGGIVSILVVDPKTPATLYAANPGGGVFKSIDRGAHWAPAMTGLTDPIVLTLVIDPVRSSTLYAGCQGGLFKSIDGAAHWTRVPSGLSNIINVTHIVIDPKTPATLYAVTDGGDQVHKSVDGGKTWTKQSILAIVSAAVLAVDPATPSTLYAGSTGQTTGKPPGGIYKSINAGKTWKLSTAGFGTGFINPTQVWVDRDNTAIVYAAINNSYLTKSSNHGATWTRVPTTFRSSLTVLTMDPSNPLVFYATDFFNIYRSQNAGKIWTALAPVSPDKTLVVTTVAVDPANANRLYAGTTDGVYASTDLGKTWSAVNRGLALTFVTALALDPKAPATLYAGIDGSGIFKTTNGGQTWTRPYVNDVRVSTLLIDPANSAKMYFSDDFGTGVWKSNNAGATWTNILPRQTINAMALDPRSPETLYAVGGNLYGSVAKSINGGKTWKSSNTGLDPFYNPNSVSADGGFVC